MKNKSLFIFDMDGVLIESEPFWRMAQIEVLQNYGVTITVEDCIKHTMGKRLDNIAQFWIERYDLLIPNEKLRFLILDKVVSLIEQEGKPKEGLLGLIAYLQSSEMRLALATSSSAPIIKAVIGKLGLKGTFEMTLSADEVPNGKPQPDVYLRLCHLLNVDVTEAVALEDSLTGVKASVSAGIDTIAIPENYHDGFKIANHVVGSLKEVQRLF